VARVRLTGALPALHDQERGTLPLAMALGLQKSPEGQICLVGLPVGIPSTLALDTYPTSLGGRVAICPQFGHLQLT
jgi:hypothetical protein